MGTLRGIVGDEASHGAPPCSAIPHAGDAPPLLGRPAASSIWRSISASIARRRSSERQILGLGRKGDVFVAISTSGRSPNVLRAIAAAREKGLFVIGFTGRTGGEMAGRCGAVLYAPSDSTPIIQQIHITAAHVVCGLVEERLFPREMARASR
jgi:D-sedoheptulose 7-phosphate isomerase